MVHTSAMATGVAIIGITKRVRASPRSLNCDAKQTAAQTPSTSGATTEAAVNQSVRIVAHLKRSSSSILAKLARPTNDVVPETFQSCTDMNSVKSHGNKITSRTTAAAGATNVQ